MQHSYAKICRINIHYLRKKRRWTQEELAYRSGVSTQEISKIESGKATPRLNVVEKISVGLEVEFVDLFDPELSTRRLKHSGASLDKLVIDFREVPEKDRVLIAQVVRQMLERARDKEVVTL